MSLPSGSVAEYTTRRIRLDSKQPTAVEASSEWEVLRVLDGHVD